MLISLVLKTKKQPSGESYIVFLRAYHAAYQELLIHNSPHLICNPPSPSLCRQMSVIVSVSQDCGKKSPSRCLKTTETCPPTALEAGVRKPGVRGWFLRGFRRGEARVGLQHRCSPRLAHPSRGPLLPPQGLFPLCLLWPNFPLLMRAPVTGLALTQVGPRLNWITSTKTPLSRRRHIHRRLGLQCAFWGRTVLLIADMISPHLYFCIYFNFL